MCGKYDGENKVIVEQPANVRRKIYYVTEIQASCQKQLSALASN